MTALLVPDRSRKRRGLHTGLFCQSIFDQGACSTAPHYELAVLGLMLVLAAQRRWMVFPTMIDMDVVTSGTAHLARNTYSIFLDTSCCHAGISRSAGQLATRQVRFVVDMPDPDLASCDSVMWLLSNHPIVCLFQVIRLTIYAPNHISSMIRPVGGKAGHQKSIERWSNAIAILP